MAILLNLFKSAGQQFSTVISGGPKLETSQLAAPLSIIVDPMTAARRHFAVERLFC